MPNLQCPAIAALAICGTLTVSASQAVLIDTFTRADGATANNSVGTTEFGSLPYIERGNTPGQSIPNGTAELTGTQLRITGGTPGGVINNNIGGVYLAGFISPNVTISADVGFNHRFIDSSGNELTDPGSTVLTNTFTMLLRSRAGVNFGTSAADRGLVDVSLSANGDVTVRELQGGAGTISSNLANSFGPVNAFNLGGVTRTKITGAANLARFANFGGQVIDANGNGYIDGSESLNFGVILEGNSLQTFINGVKVGAYTLTETTGLNGNFVGLHKNRQSSAHTLVTADIFLDNLNVSIPEPTSFAAIGTLGCLTLTRRRRSN